MSLRTWPNFNDFFTRFRLFCDSFFWKPNGIMCVRAVFSGICAICFTQLILFRLYQEGPKSSTLQELAFGSGNGTVTFERVDGLQNFFRFWKDRLFVYECVLFHLFVTVVKYCTG